MENNSQSKTKNSTREQGNKAEDVAVEYLEKNGFIIRKRNFHFGKTGEIDIVAQEADILVFIEVKARWSQQFGTPESAVTLSKQRTIRKAAEGFLYVNKIQNVECRFDVIAIDFSVNPLEIRHLQAAF